MSSVPIEDLLKLSADPSSVPLTEKQRAELDRRLDDQAQNPEAGQPWEAVRERLYKKYG